MSSFFFLPLSLFASLFEKFSRGEILARKRKSRRTNEFGSSQFLRKPMPPTFPRLPRSPLTAAVNLGSTWQPCAVYSRRYRSAEKTFHSGKIVSLGRVCVSAGAVQWCLRGQMSRGECARVGRICVNAVSVVARGARIDGKEKKRLRSVTLRRFASSLKENWRKERREKKKKKKRKKGRLRIDSIRLGRFVAFFVVLVYNLSCRSFCWFVFYHAKIERFFGSWTIAGGGGERTAHVQNETWFTTRESIVKIDVGEIFATRNPTICCSL